MPPRPGTGAARGARQRGIQPWMRPAGRPRSRPRHLRCCPSARLGRRPPRRPARATAARRRPAARSHRRLRTPARTTRCERPSIAHIQRFGLRLVTQPRRLAPWAGAAYLWTPGCCGSACRRVRATASPAHAPATARRAPPADAGLSFCRVLAPAPFAALRRLRRRDCAQAVARHGRRLQATRCACASLARLRLPRSHAFCFVAFRGHTKDPQQSTPRAGPPAQPPAPRCRTRPSWPTNRASSHARTHALRCRVTAAVTPLFALLLLLSRRNNTHRAQRARCAAHPPDTPARAIRAARCCRSSARRSPPRWRRRRTSKCPGEATCRSRSA